MEEFNFRAWDKQKNEMIEKERIEKIDFNHKCIEYDVVDAISFGEGNEAVLLGFTGITDIDGKEIYEGDIVEYTDGDFIRRRGEIEFDCYGFMLNEIKGMQVDFIGSIGDMEEMAFKVVGNIYENPDLLKVHLERKAGRL